MIILLKLFFQIINMLLQFKHPQHKLKNGISYSKIGFNRLLVFKIKSITPFGIQLWYVTRYQRFEFLPHPTHTNWYFFIKWYKKSLLMFIFPELQFWLLNWPIYAVCIYSRCIIYRYFICKIWRYYLFECNFFLTSQNQNMYNRTRSISFKVLFWKPSHT